MDPVIAAILTALGVVTAAFITARTTRGRNRSDRGMQLVDQHQEDIAALRVERKSDSQRIDRLERVVRIQGDYIGDLRRHIANGDPPPPPPYPSGLIT